MQGVGVAAVLLYAAIPDNAADGVRSRRRFPHEMPTASPLPRHLKKALWERGVSAYVRWNWLFIAPPLIITPAELREGLAQVEEVLTGIQKGE